MWDLNFKVKSESGKIPLEKRIQTECEADPRPQDATEWAGQKLGWAADAMQARHLNCTRQWNTAAQALQAHRAPETLMLVVSPQLEPER